MSRLVQGTNAKSYLQHRNLKDPRINIVQAYDDELEASLMRNLVTPACDSIETQLRLLHHHSQVWQNCSL